MSKTYQIEVKEQRQYRHDIVIQVDDDADIDAICNRIEEALNNLHGDIWNIGYTTGVEIVGIRKDKSPNCECEVLDYKDFHYSDNDGEAYG